MKEQLMKKSLSELQEILDNDIQNAIQSAPIVFWGDVKENSTNMYNEQDVNR